MLRNPLQHALPNRILITPNLLIATLLSRFLLRALGPYMGAFSSCLCFGLYLRCLGKQSAQCFVIKYPKA